MDNSLLKQVLHEYDEKRTKAIRECFMEEEKSRVTIGDMFNNLDIYVCY